VEGLTHRPRILDVDDAIHVRGNGKLAKKLALHSDAVVCGNAYLANFYETYCRNVIVIPTSIDTSRFHPLSSRLRQELRPTIGWVGTQSNLPYVEALEPALREVVRRRPDVIVRVVADALPKLPTLPAANLEFDLWDQENEVAAIQSMTIGIMPLKDGPWEAGKCSFKMLQYMACGVPVVVSDVGMNSTVLRMGEVGIGVMKSSDWIDALLWLIDHESTRTRMGEAGRQVICRHFTVERAAASWSGLLKHTIGNKHVQRS
jgi:glycosyltransferase involved in cell wall biosynthesis